MAKFQTKVQIPSFQWKTGYNNPTMLMGSCFTENIGTKLAGLKYPVDINPFGILYNPVSIAQGLNILIQQKHFESTDLIQHDGLWHSFYHHGRFSSPDRDETLHNINSRIDSSAAFLRKADFLFLSFGTAWVYEYKQTGFTVSNCHKIPDKEFRRFRLTPGEIVETWRQLLNDVWKINPRLKVIFTVSPVRHWKDGAIENQRSKAVLLLTVDALIRGFGEETCNYFPSYEIMMDELRDYRFYDEDMIHLSVPAVNHIWECFQEAMIDSESRKISQKVQKVLSAMNHRPRNTFTQEHHNFLSKSLNYTQNLQKEYPYLDLTFETEQLSNALNFVIEKTKHG